MSYLVSNLADAVQGSADGQYIQWYRDGRVVSLTGVDSITGYIMPLDGSHTVRAIDGTINIEDNSLVWRYGGNDTSTVGRHLVQFTLEFSSGTILVSIPAPWYVHKNMGD